MIDQQQLWDDEAAAGYDSPGEEMFADDVLGRCWRHFSGWA